MGFWSDWGGTAHLENLSSADAKYRDRLSRWSQTAAFPHWGPGDLATALAAIPGWYQPSRVGYPGLASTAEEYWQHVGSWWISPDSLYLTISDAQRAKIVASVKQSSASSTEYIVQRDPATHLPTKGDLWSRVPWWAWGVAGLVAWNTIRK